MRLIPVQFRSPHVTRPKANQRLSFEFPLPGITIHSVKASTVPNTQAVGDQFDIHDLANDRKIIHLVFCHRIGGVFNPLSTRREA